MLQLEGVLLWLVLSRFYLSCFTAFSRAYLGYGRN